MTPPWELLRCWEEYAYWRRFSYWLPRKGTARQREYKARGAAHDRGRW